MAETHVLAPEKPAVTDVLDQRQLLAALRRVRNGDFRVRLPLDGTGIAGDIAQAFNDVVDLNERMAKEFTRITIVVGREGRVGQRATLGAVTGSWAGCLDSVNTMIDDLTKPTTEVNRVIGAVAKGDLSQRMALELDGRPLKGEFLRSSKTVNTMVDQLSTFASEVTRVAREVGTEGKLGGQAEVEGVAGTWKDLTDSVNSMAGNLTSQVRNIAEVTTAVANGDLSKKITVDVRGEILELKNTINTMVDQLNGFASEVTRVAREVGTDGRLGGQAEVEGVAGTWKDLTDSVNSMAGNLTSQVRNIAEVTTAVANGDLSKKITVDVRGEILELKNTVNRMVDQLNGFASEVTRVAREVGTEGKLGGQADVRGVAGTWKDLTDNVNFMAGNLTVQLRDVSKVATAIANGDLTQKITVDARGEILQIKDVINRMVGQLNGFASEVTRVAREVGTDGRLGGQAEVTDVAGTWKDLTDSVNSMARNLTSQVRNIAEVTTAVANGDLSKKITVDVRGEILELKDTINTMVDQLNAFASEVTRVAREVGSEGKLGGQADVRGVAGTWKDLTDNVNFMAGNLTSQVRNIAEVTTAVANGDLSKKITVDVRGEILELKDTINTMVDQLNGFASEVTRVAREVGSEGKLGGQADVRGVAGTWKDLTDNVNFMAGNLTSQVRNIAEVTTAVANGDLSKKITVDVRGEILELKNTVNRMVDQLSTFASEVTRVAREVGSEGKLGGQADVRGVAGTWKDLTDNVNFMAGNLTSQVRNIAEVTTAVANGDLSKKITVDVRGEILELKDTINTMVDQLNGFASEVTRVAREVGSEGKLGGQADVRGVAGTWKDLTDNVNFMASNLTEQVRGIARVVTAVANGDLKRKLTLEAKGEIAALAETINDMIDTLATFADQVTTVAREVGIEGKLGGQAQVPGAAGIWRNLTDNVNELAASLATQVRAIGEVATAVTQGDLSRSIQVAAQGEVELLKDTINEMIRNLRDTTTKNQEQDWLKTNLARFTGMLQGQKDLQTVGKLILSELAPLVDAQHGVFYLNEPVEEGPLLRILATYAYRARKHLAQQFQLGEGLVGQCAYEKEMILLTNVPGDYIEISSGLGAASPLNIVVLPVLFEGEIKAVIELASFNRFSEIHLSFLEQLTESIGIVLNTLAANSRTEGLLKQSQALTMELRTQQQELQQTNEELEEKARLLAEQNQEVERRRREIDEARSALEQKADQLALTSKYKSQFLANMSHELRTPLNSLLILAQQLAENHDQNLTARQVQFAETIHSSGADLLTLINDILDLTKIESGTSTVEATDVAFDELGHSLERTFRAVADEKDIVFTIDMDPSLSPAMLTDATRLHQILKNLLSNAFKFTERGRVDLRIAPATGGWRREHQALNRTHTVVSFAVRDTGIGIPQDKQSIIFEAFQQGDMATSRKFGGTGLGLSISRELAHLLGGDLTVVSEPDAGSTFTLYLPLVYQPAQAPAKELSRVASVLDSVAALSAVGAADRADRDPDAVAFSVMPEANGANERLLLIVEEDGELARIMKALAHDRGFKVILADAEAALRLLRRLNPAAIVLDIDHAGGAEWWLLDYLKHDPRTRHIPVQVLAVEDGRRHALELGAVAHVRKPASVDLLGAAFDTLALFVDRQVKQLLVVADDAARGQEIVELLGDAARVTVVRAGAEALAALAETRVDCMVLDAALPDMKDFALIRGLAVAPEHTAFPVILYAERELTPQERAELRAPATKMAITHVASPEHLLDAAMLFLHLKETAVSDRQRGLLRRARRADLALAGKRVLIVDDDMRNIFALTSALERYTMEVAFAETGQEGIDQLTARPDIDIVLMDIMLPEVDGYETIRRIRAMPDRHAVPIIALTAKAMSGDREKCIDAGASDYISKPVDIGQLLSRLRVWMNES